MHTDRPRFRNDFVEIAAGQRVVLRPRGDVIPDADGHLGTPREKLSVILFDDDVDDIGVPDQLEVDAVIHFDPQGPYWTAAIDWTAFRYRSGQPWRPKT